MNNVELLNKILDDVEAGTFSGDIVPMDPGVGYWNRMLGGPDATLVRRGAFGARVVHEATGTCPSGPCGIVAQIHVFRDDLPKDYSCFSYRAIFLSDARARYAPAAQPVVPAKPDIVSVAIPSPTSEWQEYFDARRAEARAAYERAHKTSARIVRGSRKGRRGARKARRRVNA